MEEEIIKAVRPHLVLYDTNHKAYMKTKFKQDIWNAIAKKLNLSSGKYYEKQFIQNANNAQKTWGA